MEYLVLVAITITNNNNNADCRSVPQLVLEDVEMQEKYWQALASGLSDSGSRVNKVGIVLYWYCIVLCIVYCTILYYIVLYHSCVN